MKVLQFIYELVPGGAERFVVDLTNELAKECDIALYTLRDDSEGNSGFYVSEINNNVRYINLRTKPGFNPFLIVTFKKILETEKPDIVHCHLNLVNYFFPLSLVFRNKIKFFYTIHNSADKEIEFLLEKAIMKFFFKHGFFSPVAISDETRLSFFKYYRIDNIPVIYNGRKDISRSVYFENVVHQINKIKQSVNTKVFCHLSRYDEKQKNHKMLIRVFNRLISEGYDIMLLIIGEGFEKAYDLQRLAGSHVHFLGVKTNIADYLYLSDAFCLSSNFEGMPISLIEAFACGCPSICTPVGGIINAVIDGKTGFISKSLSENDYYNSVKKFLYSGSNINRESLVKIFHENFSIGKCSQSYLNLYKFNSLISPVV